MSRHTPVFAPQHDPGILLAAARAHVSDPAVAGVVTDSIHDAVADALLGVSRRPDRTYEGRLERISPRAAFQESLWCEALLVDIRPAAQRAFEGALDPSVRSMVVERDVLEWRFDPRHAARLPVASFDLRVIVVCQEGFMSSSAADALVRLGVHRATDIIGGFDAWRRAGMPSVTAR